MQARIESVVVAAFGAAWLFFVVALLHASSLVPTADAQQHAPAVVTLEGSGDDVSIAFDAGFGLYRVAWYGPCAIAPVLWTWDGDEAHELATLRQGVVPFRPGTYFVAVDGVDCDWSVYVSPT